MATRVTRTRAVAAVPPCLGGAVPTLPHGALQRRARIRQQTAAEDCAQAGRRRRSQGQMCVSRTCCELPAEAPRRGPYRPWAEPLKRTFGFDILHCVKCQGRMRLLAVLTEYREVRRYLRGIGEAPEAIPGTGIVAGAASVCRSGAKRTATELPTQAPARGPPFGNRAHSEDESSETKPRSQAANADAKTPRQSERVYEQRKAKTDDPVPSTNSSHSSIAAPPKTASGTSARRYPSSKMCFLSPTLLQKPDARMYASARRVFRESQARPAAYARDGRRVDGAKAAHEYAPSRACKIPAPAPRPRHLLSKSSLSDRYHVHSNARGLRLPSLRDGLVFEARLIVAALHHDGYRILRRSA
jgi:hypothetical protein